MPARDAPERPVAGAGATWEGVATAPFGLDLELAVIEGKATPSSLGSATMPRGGWVKAATAERVMVQPTHWRAWIR